ncbi:MAG TPA: hypothetical protein VMZ06_17905 [Candidatus Bathyarchaeia archaeon]|nr:hypothetical protein [Candidatus Bathyarchaeia archaeon]
MKNQELDKLPANALSYIETVAAKSSLFKRMRLEVRRELASHFADAIGAANGNAEQAADLLIREFGDPRLLAKLIRRGKTRCQPLWLQGILWAFGLGLLTGVPIMVYGIYLNFVGTPVRDTDYLAVMNERAAPQDANPDENAWPHYVTAITDLDHPAEIRALLTTWRAGCGCGGDINLAPPPLEPNDLPVVKAWIDRAGPVWVACVTGAGKPWCWRTYVPRDGDTRLWAVGPAYEIPRNWLTLTYIPLRFAYHRDTGDIDAAVEDALVLAKMGAHFSRFGAWTEGEQTYGFGNLKYAGTMLRSLVPQLARDHLTDIQAQLEALVPDGFPEADGSTFRLAALDLVQHTYSSGGVFGGHFMPRYFRTVDGYYPGFNAYPGDGVLDKLALPVVFTLGGMLVPGRDAAEDRIERAYAEYAPLLRMSPYERHAEGPGNDLARTQPPKPNRFIRALQLPMKAISYGVGTIGQRNGIERWWMIADADARYATKAGYEATLAVIALQLYKLDKGQYPDALDPLLAGYLRKMPSDPWGGGPLRYIRKGNKFLLYGIRSDFTDNGGQHPDPDNPQAQADVIYADWP